MIMVPVLSASEGIDYEWSLRGVVQRTGQDLHGALLQNKNAADSVSQRRRNDQNLATYTTPISPMIGVVPTMPPFIRRSVASLA
jgi:hypothetical protein